MSLGSTLPELEPLHNGSCESTILVFGPHTGTNFTKEHVERMIRPLAQSQHREWILETVAGLPGYWDALVAKIPQVAEVLPHVPQSLAILDAWFRYGPPEDDNVTLPLPALGPVVVLTQLLQYWQFLEMTHKGERGPTVDVLAGRSVSTGPRSVALGYCSGLVPAAAAASARNRDQFKRYAAVAMRLSVLIGGLTDAREAWDKALDDRGASVSLATAWVGPQQAEDMVRITEALAPDAYLATVYDEARAILKTNEQTAPLLQKRLRAAGIIAIQMEIAGGHVHSPHPDIQRTTDALVQLAHSMPGLQYADLNDLVLPTYDNRGEGRRILPDHPYGLTEAVLRGIFVQQCQWYGTFSAVVEKEPKPFVVNFGPERCVPPTWMGRLGTRQVHFEDIQKKAQGLGLLPRRPTVGLNPSHHASDTQRPTGPTESVDLVLSGTDLDKNSIAVIGMSVKTAGADDLHEFAEMLRTGQSQHVAITRASMDRIMMDSLFHPAPDSDPHRRQWYGCFVRDPDAFDHKFFKRSPREAAAMDPQGRQALEAAYQAVEQSGYFQLDARRHGIKQQIGVYLGSGGVDYEENSASHEPSAFTTTGILKSFIAGRISHYFGWTGPAMTLNTACSSSAVAIHTACRSILSGECTAALAGGSQAITKMAWFQDLAAGSFLSPTGQCKPFDDKADGYCRGEGYGWVFLKRLPDAVRDGHPILAVIPSTAVNQNENSTSLFVPNASSLSTLFREVLRTANVAPHDISLVEAHGTGTPVGDPVEYESIRSVLGGSARSGRQPTNKLVLGSVKGHIGHTEAASGVLGLIKVIMMMRGAFIPPQASFHKMSSRIDVRPDDMMEVVTALRSWEGHKIALLNNYGASGSNASLIVAQAPKSLSQSWSNRRNGSTTGRYRYPFWITGLDNRAISAYAAKMVSYCRSLSTKEEGSSHTLADVSFAVNRQSNRGLAQGFLFSCDSMAELEDKLEQAAASKFITPVPAERPVILCFGGQVSRFVGLDRKVYEEAAIFRRHLDNCDTAVTSLGLNSIYPGIFSQQPIRDTVELQTMLFAMQYACAKAWMDCGIEETNKIAAVVGHSFGEITALCIAGVLSLHDTVKLVAARAGLVRDQWGSDPGAMVAVEVDDGVDGEALVQEFLQQVNNALGPSSLEGSASIVCYNGARSFTLAGSTAAVDAIEETLALQDGRFSAIKQSKRLNVTNAFHSALVEKLVDDLGRVGKGLTFHKPAIPVELCTKEGHYPNNNDKRLDAVDWTFVPRHMREPVFFDHAVQRLAKRHPQAIFLEAGSNSTITVMATRALAQSKAATPSHHFQAVSITNSNKGFDNLTDATVALWSQGLRVSFWAHHPQQTLAYVPLVLPPYQFNKSSGSRHWLPVKSPLDAVRKAVEEALLAQQSQLEGGGREKKRTELALWDFVGHYNQDGGKGAEKARFRINTASEPYQRLAGGHVIAQTAPICPGTLEQAIIVETLFHAHPEFAEEGMLPVLRDLVGEAPICADPSRVVYLELEALDEKERQWGVCIFSVDTKDAEAGHSQSQSQSRIHAQAHVEVRSPTDTAYGKEFAHFERLASHARCQELLNLRLDEDGVESLQGRQVYRAFAPVVDYAECYRGVRYVVGRGAECAGLVQLDRRHRHRHRQERDAASSWLLDDVPLSDCFSQVAGLWVNVMTDCPPEDMYIGTGCQLSMRSPRHKVVDRVATDKWHVYARHLRQETDAASTYTTDVFVFDAANGSLVEVMLGVGYQRVSKASMSKMLAHMTKDESVLRIKKEVALSAATTDAILPTPHTPNSKLSQQRKKKQQTKNKKTASSTPAPGRRDITDQVRNLVSELSGVDAQDMTLESNMADLGIDSLMNMELGRGVERTFGCTIGQAEQLEATTLGLFVRCVERALFGATAAGQSNERPLPLADDDDDDWDALDDGDSAEALSSVVMVDQEPASPSTAATPSSGSSDQDNNKDEEALSLSASTILSSFGEVKMSTDTYLREWKLDHTEKAMMAGNGRLLSALVVEALTELGCDLDAAAAGQTIDRVPFLPQHGHLVDAIYRFLEVDARLVDRDPASGQLMRTHVPVPSKPSSVVLEELLAQYPDLGEPCHLVYYACKHLAGVLSGKTDGIKVLFGSPEARERTVALYYDYRVNRMRYAQIRDVINKVCERASEVLTKGETLKILEMGAGTGGTTRVLLPRLVSLGIPVEYTFTDLSSSMVASARRRWGKEYPFMRFFTHDIEQAPEEHLRGAHIVLASNAVHATHNLVTSLRNIRQALRPDGFVMLTEMTENVHFIDIPFGMLESWWLFDDGRTHAIVDEHHWERAFHAAGFGHVDWTDGHLPEAAYQKVIMAMASGEQGERLPIADIPVHVMDPGNVTARTVEADRLVAKYSSGWESPRLKIINAQREKMKDSSTDRRIGLGAVVLVTGATGSLGAHIVQKLAENPAVFQVVCVNRPGSSSSSNNNNLPGVKRQQDAFRTRGINLTPGARAKLRVMETDTSQVQLGLAPQDYAWLVQHVTHIVHNAWPMSATRPIGAYEPQFQVMRNLLDLVREVVTSRVPGHARAPVGFQFVSSIGVVGFSNEARVRERRVPLEATLPSGYGEGKWVCERMLDETLQKYPALSRAMVVRPGQIAGSSTSGYWNPVEHFAFLVKSSQTLRAWPDLDGTLQWLPVDLCGAVAAELVLNPDAVHPVYHIDNPVGQPWKRMSPVLARALDIPAANIVPFQSWIKRVRTSPLAETENPAGRPAMAEFLGGHFERMSCGGLILDVERAKEHSVTMAGTGPVSPELAVRYINGWREMGFLH